MSTLTTVRSSEPWRRRLYLPAYQVRDAARYAQSSVQTVGYWHYHEAGLGPALPGRKHRQPLSYLQLVEVAFVATFRALDVSLQRIRRAHSYAAQRFQSEYPFADYKWQTEGKHLLLNLKLVERETLFDDLVIIGDMHGQEAWQPMLGARFAQFDYEQDLAVIWHVAGTESRVAIDPRVAYGAPTVLGIPTWTIRGRYIAGESIDDIEDDFGIPGEQIEDALRFEGIELSPNDNPIL